MKLFEHLFSEDKQYRFCNNNKVYYVFHIENTHDKWMDVTLMTEQDGIISDTTAYAFKTKTQIGCVYVIRDSGYNDADFNNHAFSVLQNSVLVGKMIVGKTIGQQQATVAVQRCLFNFDKDTEIVFRIAPKSNTQIHLYEFDSDILFKNKL